MAVPLVRPGRVLAVVISVTVIAVPWYYVVKTIHDAQPVNSPVRPSSVYWGRLYFNTSRDLSRWLHRRGVAYAVWADRHPHAAARIGR